MSSRRRPGQADEDDDMGVAPQTPTRSMDETTTSSSSAVADDKLLEKTLGPPQLAPAVAPGAFASSSSSPNSSERTKRREADTASKPARSSDPSTRSHQSSRELRPQENTGEMDHNHLEEADLPGAVRVGGGDQVVSMIAAKESMEAYEANTGRSGRAADGLEEEGALKPKAVTRGDVESQLPQPEESSPPREEDGSPRIVAHLAPDEDELAERLAKRVQAEVQRRLEEQQNEALQNAPNPNNNNNSNRPAVVQAIKIEDAVKMEPEPAAQEESPSSSSPSRKYWICLLLLMIIGGVVAAVVVAVSGGDDDGEDVIPTATPTVTETPAPSASPTPAPVTPSPTTASPSATPTMRTFSPRFEMLYAIMADLVDDPSVLRDDSTRQHWALQWLAESDEAQLDYQFLPTHIAVERFALVLLHNSTGGSLEQWNEQYNFLSPFPVCSWNNVVNLNDGEEVRGVECIGSSVSELVLRENSLSGIIPTELGLMTSLTFLDFYSNALFGSVTPILEHLPPIVRRFWVGNNFLTGSIPSNGTFPLRESITGFDIQNNIIGGTFPPDFFLKIPNLAGVSLEDNIFEGTIPTELFTLSNSLSFLDIHNNDLTGTIPTEFGLLTKLTTLLLQEQPLTGTIPTELGELTDMVILLINNMELTGTLPTELGLLTSMTSLYINTNDIVGRVPEEYSNLQLMVNFVAHYTQLTGGFNEVWCTGQRATPYQWLYADCRPPVQEVECMCCTFCCTNGAGCIENEDQSFIANFTSP